MANIPGPTTLAQGDTESGYYGTLTGLITATDLFTKTGMTAGTTLVSGDITWLKFSHKGRIIFIASASIKSAMSWDQLNNLLLIRGKVIDINNMKYLCRSMRGTHSNPAPSYASTTYPTDQNIIGSNSELYNCLLKFTPEYGGTVYGDWCQETSLYGITYAVRYGSGKYLDYNTKSNGSADNGWRPVLEVL